MRPKSALTIALLGIVLAAGCSKGPDDAAVVTNIKSQIRSDAQLKESSLQVTSSEGQVTLSGTVPSVAARLDAYKIAAESAGVKKVNDQMIVQSPAVRATAPGAAPSAVPAPRAKPSQKSRVKEPAPPTEPLDSAQYVPVQPDLAPSPVAQPPATAQPVAQPAPAPAAPPAPQPREVEVAASSTVTVRMIDGVDSSVNRAGEIFHATLEAPLVVEDQVVVPRGADVYVRLTNASSAGHMTGKSELHLELVKLEFQGRSYSLVSSTYSVAGSSRGKNTAAKVGGGAVLGALIGGLAGGGKGAAIGAGVGAGSGAVWNGVTRGKQVKIPAETKLDFQLEQPVTITVMPHSTASAQ